MECHRLRTRPRPLDPAEARINAAGRRYGVGINEIAALFASQCGACAICAASFGSFEDCRFYIDHDHATAAVRGLLCHRCNTGLGFFRDDEAALAAAIAYLSRSRLAVL